MDKDKMNRLNAMDAALRRYETETWRNIGPVSDTDIAARNALRDGESKESVFKKYVCNHTKVLQMYNLLNHIDETQRKIREGWELETREVVLKSVAKNLD